MPLVLSDAAVWPPLESLYRLTLALGVGLFVGLEREWRGKEAGLRTFGLVALLGGLGGMVGESYSLVCMVLIGVLVFVLNWQSLRENKGAELTTSAALLITGFCGVLCGQGQTITPTAVGVVTAGLLSWKESLAIFSHKLTAEELRAEILLAILTFAIYPVLPTHTVDPWGLIEPRAAWMTVILIAAIGFVNYILWKISGEKGLQLTSFFGGLVNSTVAVTELSNRVRESGGELEGAAYGGVLLSTVAMAIRNALILGILDFETFKASLFPLALLLLPCVWSFWQAKKSTPSGISDGTPILPLKTPFSLVAAIKFGMIFLVMQMLAALANASLGKLGFYAISAVGGLVSSASAVAAAAALVGHGKILAGVGGIGAIVASLASTAVNIFIVAKFANSRNLTIRLAKVLLFGIFLSTCGLIVQSFLLP